MINRSKSMQELMDYLPFCLEPGDYLVTKQVDFARTRSVPLYRFLHRV